MEPVTTAEVVGKTTLPIQGWVKDLSRIPKAGVAQAQTVACWVSCLRQHSQLSSSSFFFKKELQKILCPVMHHRDAPEETTVLHQRGVI